MPEGPTPAPRSLAVLIPCRDEALTVARVVERCRAALPHARIVVIDNGSLDGTAALARKAGAEVLDEPRPGKGFAMRTGFAGVREEACVMVDGDDTYPIEQAGALLAPVFDGTADMVVGARLGGGSRFLPGRQLGNHAFAALVRMLYGLPVTDLFSGFRAFGPRFLRQVRLDSSGFEIEAEMTIRAARLGLRVHEVPVTMSLRPPGSRSKLRAVADGMRILRRVLELRRG